MGVGWVGRSASGCDDATRVATHPHLQPCHLATCPMLSTHRRSQAEAETAKVRVEVERVRLEVQRHYAAFCRLKEEAAHERRKLLHTSQLQLEQESQRLEERSAGQLRELAQLVLLRDAQMQAHSTTPYYPLLPLTTLYYPLLSLTTPLPTPLPCA